MIKTITALSQEEFDKAVNEFERTCVYPTGTSRVFATQTHVLMNPGMPSKFVAVIFYKGEEI